MLSSFIITFRESLEAALIVGIILSYLCKTNQSKHNNTVYIGIAAGIVASILGAFLFEKLAGGFEGRSEQIFEGVTMFIGAILLTTMILWMLRQKNVSQNLKNKVAENLSDSKKMSLFLLVFVAVLREGIETVIFLGAANFASGNNSIVGALLGIIAAVILGFIIFVGSIKVDLKKFFNVTSVILILFAAGLVAHGVHEFEEAGLIPEIGAEIWNINHILNEKSNVGSFLKGLFGYNGNPSLTEVISWFVYLVGVSITWIIIGKNRLKSSK